MESVNRRGASDHDASVPVTGEVGESTVSSGGRRGGRGRAAHVHGTMKRLDGTIAVEVGRKDDIENGGKGGEAALVREQCVKLRTTRSAKAMGSYDRTRVKVEGIFNSVKNILMGESVTPEGEGTLIPDPVVVEQEAKEQAAHGVSGSTLGADPSRFGQKSLKPGEVQYRLESRRKAVWGWRRFLCAQYVSGDLTDTYAQCCCMDLNRVINNYLHWTFRTSFAVLFLSMIVFYVAFTLLFAGLLMWAGTNRPNCVASDAFADYDSFTNVERFHDVYQLSWTTFSTVGYGLVYPETSAGYTGTGMRECTGVKILCSIEAFFGVLFSGLCGAILFGKISRIQGFAQVSFSDPIVIQYGSGVSRMGADEDEDDDSDDESEGKRGSRIPCPTIEFRIANRLHSTMGGEIMDATLNCVASIEAQQACPDIRRLVNPHLRARRKFLRRLNHHEHKKADELTDPKGDAKVDTTNEGLRSSIAGTTRTVGKGAVFSNRKEDNSGDLPDESYGHAQLVQEMVAASGHQAMEEDASTLVPKRIFSRVEIDTGSHPFFKRIWVARHVLNEQSPLLTNKVKNLIRKNNGHWPEELKNYKAVRESICFNQLLISLSGTCNVNGASVYAQKSYHFSDTTVGYKFANALFRDMETGALKVDMRLLNDVVEQDGEDMGEPFVDEEGETIGAENV